MSVPDFSALHCPPRGGSPAPKQKANLVGWNVEMEDQSAVHPCFEANSGIYTVSTDGLYSLIIQLIPIGGANFQLQSRRRESVDYVVRIQEPPEANSAADDIVDSEYGDIGTFNFAELLHFKAGTRVTCMRMPSGRGTECVRFKVALVQRKRKRPNPPELSKKELKKRKKMKRKAESSISCHSAGADSSHSRQDNSGAETSKSCDSSEYSSDSDWSDGFESDTSQDHLPHSRRGVKLLAKRFKCTPTPDLS